MKGEIEVLECFRPRLAKWTVELWERALDGARRSLNLFIDVPGAQGFRGFFRWPVEGMELPIVWSQGIPVPSFVAQTLPGVNTRSGRVYQCKSVYSTRASYDFASRMADAFPVKIFLGDESLR